MLKQPLLLCIRFCPQLGAFPVPWRFLGQPTSFSFPIHNQSVFVDMLRVGVISRLITVCPPSAAFNLLTPAPSPTRIIVLPPQLPPNLCLTIRCLSSLETPTNSIHLGHRRMILCEDYGGISNFPIQTFGSTVLLVSLDPPIRFRSIT